MSRISVPSPRARSARRWVDFNSFTGLGERTSLVGYSTLDGNEQRVIQGVEEFRIGGGGLLANFSLAYGTTNPGGDISILGLNGNSLVGEASLTYPIVRSRRTNIELSEGFDFIQQNINLGTFALTRDRLRIFNAKISGGYNWRGSIPGSFNIDVEARKGVTAMGSSHAGDPDLSRVEGRPDAFEVRSAGSLDVNWLPYLSTHGAYQAQYANAPLLAYEELPVGNLTIGRGYDPAVVSGDNGLEGSFELRLGSFPVFGQFGVSAIGILRRRSRHQPRQRRTGRDLALDGRGIGISIRRCRPSGCHLRAYAGSGFALHQDAAFPRADELHSRILGRPRRREWLTFLPATPLPASGGHC